MVGPISARETAPGNAGRISSYLKGAFTGRSAGAVHSCFNTSFNFTLGDRLIHAGPSGRPLCCFGMELAGEQAGEMLQAIAPGDLVSCRDGRIAVYGRNVIFTLHTDQMEMVDLRIEHGTPREDAALWELLLELELDGQLGIEMDEGFGACYRTLKAFARSAGAGEGDTWIAWGSGLRPDEAQNASASPAGPLLQSNGPAFTAPGLAEAVSWLIGRGKGLTPSGDDILLGYGAGLLALDPSGAGRRFLNILAGCLHGQTTDISLGYYSGLDAGYVNENMKFLLRGFWSSDREDARRWIRSVRAVGHTSGCDTLYGLRLAAAIKMRDGEVIV